MPRYGGAAPQPVLPEGEERRAILVLRHEPDLGGVLPVGDRVAPHVGEATRRERPHRQQVRQHAHGHVLLHEGGPGDLDGLLREQARQVGGVLGEEAAAAAEPRDVAEEVRVGVRAGPEPDHRDRDAGLPEARHEGEVVARLLGVGGVGEEHDVARALRRAGELLRSGDERGVGEDPAAAGLDGADPAEDAPLVREGHQRHDDVRGGVDRDHRHGVAAAEQLDRGARPEVGEVHLRLARRDRHPHRPGAVERDGHRQEELALLLPDLHRHRQDLLDRGLVVAARSERRPAAGHEQAAAEVAHVGGSASSAPGGRSSSGTSSRTTAR